MESRSVIRDPMLHAAAEALVDHPDHLRWLCYADAEMTRLRERLNLPAPDGYSAGMPNYWSNVSEQALKIVTDVENALLSRFSTIDRLCVGQVIEDILKEASGVASQ